MASSAVVTATNPPLPDFTVTRPRRPERAASPASDTTRGRVDATLHGAAPHAGEGGAARGVGYAYAVALLATGLLAWWGAARMRVRRAARRLRMARREAAASSRALATACHEIRTPMHGILGALELLGGTALDERQRALIGTVNASAEGLLRVLDDVLDHARLDAGALAVECVPIDIARIVADVASLFSPAAREKGLTIDVGVEPGIAPRHAGDAVRLRQVLLNVVGNAVKFTAAGGVTVHVGATDVDADMQRIVIDVRDTGIGIAPEHVDRVFAPFGQADVSTARRYGGSGLGLSICRRLMTLFGGTIALSSEPGRGTQVTLELDCRVLPQAPVDTADPSDATPAEATRALDVLVAEDHPLNRELVAAQLARLGHRCHLAGDGAEALELAATRAVDVLLTDLRMPVVDGFALTRAVRDRGMTFPIAAMTASAMPGERERCLDAAMNGFVTKPVRLADLRRLLSELVDGGTPPPSPCSGSEWEDAYGDPALFPSLVQRFADSARADLAALPTLRGTDEIAAWLHRVLGGMRVFGPSPEAALAERLERALRDGRKEAMADLPAFTAQLERYVDALERFARARDGDA